MHKDIIKFNDLIKEKRNNLYLVLTNDIDSLISCNFLMKNYGIPIGGFYDFKEWRKSSNVIYGKRSIPFFVDGDISYPYYCVGNHPRLTKNSNCFNLNQNIGERNYTKKIACSTFYVLLWLNNMKAYNKMTFKQKELLLMLDSFYMQYFKFNNIWNVWNKYCKTEDLTDIVKRKTYDEWEELSIELGLSKHIYLKNNSLVFGFDIDYINNQFDIKITTPDIVFDKSMLQLDIVECKATDDIIEKDIFSGARIYKNSFRYSRYQNT